MKQNAMGTKKLTREETKYYLILDNILGKRANGEDFLFQDGKWVLDEKCLIKDKIIGYDPTEEPGSPYYIGNSDIMDEIQTISFEEAMKRTGGAK